MTKKKQAKTGKAKTAEPLASYLFSAEGTYAPISPVLKWAGGKGQLIPQMAPFLPKKFNTYHEPFLGGAAVFFYLAPLSNSCAFLSDAVPDLINFYIVLRDRETEFIEGVRVLDRKYQTADIEEKEKIFYKYRLLDRSKRYADLDDLTKAIRFYFLNKTAFNGLYRTNSSGLFNVPWGKYEKPSLYVPSDLRNAAEVLRLFGKYLVVADFEVVLDNAKVGDFVYFDPPYVPLSLTSSFTSYSAGGFDLNDQQRLAAICRELDRRNVLFMLSNSDVPVIHQSFKKFDIKTLSARRNINSNGDKRGPVNELLIKNY